MLDTIILGLGFLCLTGELIIFIYHKDALNLCLLARAGHLTKSLFENGRRPTELLIIELDSQLMG